LADCAARCERCAACHYVSLSLANEDCSWYTQCDLDHLIDVGANYTSEAVSPVYDPSTALYALGMALVGGGRVLLLVSKSETLLHVRIDGAALASAQVLEGVGSEPGFVPPREQRLDSNGELTIGPFAVVLVEMGVA